ncbi:transposase [Candidatus Woesebacteria bacterium]|nr:transposase [Candidatus Woesebacteria bacterium]
MPLRKVPLVTGSYYHLFNRGINRQPTFLIKSDYERFIQTTSFYRPTESPIKYSQFLKNPHDVRADLLSKIDNSPHQITIVAYCLMPNHFHLLLRQNEDGGISKFLGDVQNSYVKYFNVKHKRTGSLFDRQFKAVLVETENQLLHLTRYIHLNPYSSHMVDSDHITTYPYSSLPEYISGKFILSDPNQVMEIYPKRYESFVLNHADYQQRLESIKHLTIDEPLA